MPSFFAFFGEGVSMFLFNSLHKRNPASSSPNRLFCKRAGVFALFVMFCLSTAFLFTGCSTGNDPVVGTIDGTWIWDDTPAYAYRYIINLSAKTIEYKGQGAMFPYEGAIEYNSNPTADSGVVIIKYTKYADWGDVPSTTHANAGKYGALYWTELTVGSVRMADAIDLDGSFDHVLKNTSSEATAAFTPPADKVGVYVGWGNTSPLHR
jgi:hypothetical protein